MMTMVMKLQLNEHTSTTTTTTTSQRNTKYNTSNSPSSHFDEMRRDEMRAMQREIEQEPMFGIERHFM